jgi:hypothetical protein
MSTRQKKSGQTHRKICCCEAFQCNAGVYLDAHGNSHTGVELTREAYDAHQRAEIRNRARASLSPSASSTPQSIRSVSRGQSDLISPLSRMVLNRSESENSPSGHSRSHALVPERDEDVSSISRQSEDQGIEQSNVEQDVPAIATSSNISETRSSRKCMAARSARNAGVKTYDSSRFSYIFFPV